MNRKQYEIDNLPTQIVIGHQTETGVTSIYFDCTSWLASWPDLVLGVWATQPGGTAAYPAATHMEGDVLVWDVTDSDTAVPGVGTVEIVGTASGKKKLSAIAKTQIMRTTTGTTTTPPEGAKAWVDNVMQAASDAETSKTQAATYAQNAAASAEKSEENAKSVTWETLSGKPSAFPPETHGHAMSEVDGLPDALSQLKNDIGDDWTSGTTYYMGDYCISGNRLYKCKTSHTAGSAFISDYWESTRICDEITRFGVLTFDYVGKGIDSGQNERSPSFDFTDMPKGLYLVKNGDRNIGTDLYALALVSVGGGLTYTQVVNHTSGAIFSNDGFTLYGRSASWNCYLYVYKVNLSIPFF